MQHGRPHDARDRPRNARDRRDRQHKRSHTTRFGDEAKPEPKHNEIDAIMGKNGESQDLAGLINVGTMHVRDTCMRQFRASAIASKSVLDARSKHTFDAVMAEIDRVQNANLMLGDCEDTAFANVSAMQAASMYNTEAEFDVDIDRTLAVVLSHDCASHDGIKTILRGYRTACLESDPREFVGTSLVWARGAHLDAQVMKGNGDKTPRTIQALKTDFEVSQSEGMAGHAVCTTFKITKPISTPDGLCLAEVVNWKTHEGTADTRLYAGGSLDEMHVAFDETGIEANDIKKYNGMDMNCVAGENVMSLYMARRSTATCQAKFPTVPVTFTGQQVCDPCDNVSSFYRYAIAFSQFYVFTHEDGINGLMMQADSHQIGQPATCCESASKLLSCASMVLGQQEQGRDVVVPTARPIAICAPISSHERNLISTVAWAHRAMYPTLDNLLESAKETKFYLMPTMEAGHCVDGVKVGSFLRVGDGDMTNELRLRDQMAKSVGADAVRNLNSHAFSFVWRVNE